MVNEQSQPLQCGRGEHVVQGVPHT
jgi:hypothetical protein